MGPNFPATAEKVLRNKYWRKMRDGLPFGVTRRFFDRERWRYERAILQEQREYDERSRVRLSRKSGDGTWVGIVDFKQGSLLTDEVKGRNRRDKPRQA